MRNDPKIPMVLLTVAALKQKPQGDTDPGSHRHQLSPSTAEHRAQANRAGAGHPVNRSGGRKRRGNGGGQLSVTAHRAVSPPEAS